MAGHGAGSSDTDGSRDEDAAARLVHDLRTRLMTIRNIAALLDRAPAERHAIEAQLDRIGARLDDFWGEVAGPVSTAQADKATAPGEACFHILYVDDDEIHRDIGDRLLSQLGHKVTLCADGLTAQEQCRTEIFDLIFLDEHAPVLSGTRFASSWEDAMAPRPRPYMVGMSNDPRAAALRMACLDAGMQDYMEKPLTSEKLTAVLARAEKALVS
jgi:CheY-like chemotaxis protein